MSGGFFRGTSADQDTRFSNKQAKLMKSQKFAPELDHLVDMTRVKMDVIRPWIATRATELLGFEDEVLINFVYGLLDGKAADGKQIQIQLTGFMEKNTGRFMKELWSLLLSAQNNVSGVPQQFLDAKEEETRKKKAEADRIAEEIQKRKEKEGRELERERQSRFDGEADISRSIKGAHDLVPKHSMGRASSDHPEEEREVDERHGSRAKNGRSRSPHPNDHSLSPYWSSPSPTRSSNKSISRSRSYSEEGHKSRSVSVSSQSQRHSVSPERRYRSPVRRSLSPERRYRSPRHSISPRRRHSPRNARSSSMRRSPHPRRRSASHSRHRSPSPFRQRSPHVRRRSPPFLRHRSRSPLRRRSPSPLHHRSPSPSRRRSPVRARRRSPSPLHRRSPIQHRSLSPERRRPPFPLRRKSPPPRSPKHRKRSLLRSPKSHPADSQISPQKRNRSRSPYRSQSPLYRTRRSLSRERDSRIDGIESRRYRDEHTSQRTREKSPLYRTRRSLSRERDSRIDGIESRRSRDEHTSQRTREKRSPVCHALEREQVALTGLGHKVLENVSHNVPISLRSPQRDMGNQSENRNRMPVVLPERSPSQSESPTHVRKKSSVINRRSRSLPKSPGRQTRVRKLRHDSRGTSREEEETSRAREASCHRTDSSRKRSKDLSRDVALKRSYANDLSPELYSPDRVATDQSPAAHGRLANSELRKKDSGPRSDINVPERHVQQLSRSSEDIEYGPGRVSEERGSLDYVHDRQRSAMVLARDAPSTEKGECNEQTVKISNGDGYGVNDEKRPQPKSDEYRESHYETESVTRSKKKYDKKNRLDTEGSDSEESDSYRHHNTEKRRHKKTDKRKRDSDESSESDSQIDDRKEAKRRRKDAKRLRKEERRRRREERHRRRLERCSGKLKVKSMDTVTPPSDFEKNHNDADDSDVDDAIRKDSHPSDADETASPQKKLEIELREKALESLRAKKAISH